MLYRFPQDTRSVHVLLVTLLSVFLGCRPSRSYQPHAYDYTINKTDTGSRAAVVSAHPLASEAGMWVLKAGGNAVDAAIATQLALAVVFPQAGNLGGGGFLVAHLRNGQTVAIDYREKAPGRAHRDMYLDSSGQVITDLSLRGHLAAGVPGTVSGLVSSHRYGRLPWKMLVEPAIRLARQGHVITSSEARNLNRLQEKFRLYNTVSPVFVTRTWKEGDTLIQEDLARTLERIRDQGADGFYKGETARLIEEEMKRGGGWITRQDLEDYQAKERPAYRFAYKGFDFVSMPLPASGGILLHQMLSMVENRGLDTLSHLSPEAIQLMVEAERRAYADRARYLGDPDFVKVPVQTITSRPYLEQRMKSYVPGRAGNSDEFDWTKTSIPDESTETTHLSVLDPEGNAVAVTTTLNGSYGCYTVVGGAGFFLNNEMDDFSSKPGVPNMYGALGTEANAIAPGKRMLSSMTPTIVLKDGKPFIIVGTPGGTTIPTTVFQTIVNLLDFKTSPWDAINTSRFHHQWRPDLVEMENSFPETVQDSLRRMGYTLKIVTRYGKTELIVIRDGRVIAVADDRGDDSAEVW